MDRISMRDHKPMEIPFETEEGEDRPIVLDAHTQAEFNRMIRPAFGVPQDTPLFEIVRRLDILQNAIDKITEEKGEAEVGDDVEISDSDRIEIDEKKMCEAVDALCRKTHPEVIGVAGLEVYGQIFYAALGATISQQIRVGQHLSKKQQSSPQ